MRLDSWLNQLAVRVMLAALVAGFLSLLSDDLGLWNWIMFMRGFLVTEALFCLLRGFLSPRSSEVSSRSEPKGVGLLTDAGEDDRQYLICYVCPRCDHGWSDVWDCACDDDCPRCGLGNITPTEYHLIDDQEQKHPDSVT